MFAVQAKGLLESEGAKLFGIIGWSETGFGYYCDRVLPQLINDDIEARGDEKKHLPHFVYSDMFINFANATSQFLKEKLLCIYFL